MKKTMIIVLVVVLALTALAGCGSRSKDDTVDPTPGVDNNDTAITPEDNNGMVNDGNGIIGDSGNANSGNADNGNATDTDVPEEGILPEIGSDIEQGANDIIDGVGDAIEGNDNNAASGNTNSDAGDNARGRARVR